MEETKDRAGSRKTLSAWLKETNTTARKLAIESGVSPSTISRFLAGKTKMGPWAAIRIHDATGKAVTLRALLYPEGGER